MSTIISQLYHSRRILLDQLKKRGYFTEDYNNFSFNEIRMLYTNKQLDILLNNPANDKKIYIKYHLGTKLRPAYIYDYIEDLYNIEDILTPKDELIIIIKDKISDNLIKLMKSLYIKDKIYFNILNLKQLGFNILDHILVPPHRILNKEEENNIRKKYNITDDAQFPEISRFDPVAMAIGLRPNDLCEIIRPSKTALKSKYYRLCY